VWGGWEVEGEDLRDLVIYREREKKKIRRRRKGEDPLYPYIHIYPKMHRFTT